MLNGAADYVVADLAGVATSRAVSVECNYCAFSLLPGWALRLAVSQTYWQGLTLLQPLQALTPHRYT